MRSAVAAGCLLLGLATVAQGQVALQLESTRCLFRELPLAQAFTLQITAWNAPGSSFERLEFRVTGFSADDPVVAGNVTPNPEAVSAVGNPFEEGAIITFADCQDTTEPVLLYTATVLSFLPSYTPSLEVLGIGVPSDPAFPCPTSTCGASVACISSWVSIRQILVPPSDPYPPDGATGVSPDVQLSARFGDACHCLGLPCTGLSFGVDPDPPSFGGGCDAPLPQPAPLEPFTTYYWRVSMSVCGEFATSPVWSFTTGRSVSSSPVEWGRVKALFR